MNEANKSRATIPQPHPWTIEQKLLDPILSLLSFSCSRPFFLLCFLDWVRGKDSRSDGHVDAEYTLEDGGPLVRVTSLKQHCVLWRLFLCAIHWPANRQPMTFGCHRHSSFCLVSCCITHSQHDTDIWFRKFASSTSGAGR
jgi:hypothetical protein